MLVETGETTKVALIQYIHMLQTKGRTYDQKDILENNGWTYHMSF